MKKKSHNASHYVNFLSKGIDIYFVKKSLFTLSSIVVKSPHRNMTTINKIRPNYARIKIQIDLKAYLLK